MKWKDYRARYADLPLVVHREMYDGLAATGNSQRRWHEPLTKQFFEVAKPKRVVELGGWDGEMAKHILRENDVIESWTNYELANVNPVCVDPRFTTHVLDDEWAWDHAGFTGDAFVSSHSIEHINVDQVRQILIRLQDEYFKYVFIQTPIPVSEKPNWEKWPNSGHIIECSMNDLDKMFIDAGWNNFMKSSVGADQIRGWQ